MRVIENGTDTLQWLLADHLGSTSVTTTDNGTLNSILKYSAFGEIWASSGTTLTDYRYTNQLEQSEIGLYYYNARWYDPQLGRFVQADTIVPGAGNAMAYDRYAYVLNNPINGTDPSGNATCDEFGHCYEYGKRVNNKATLTNMYSQIVNFLSYYSVDLSTYKGYRQENYNDCGATAAAGGDKDIVDRIKSTYDNHPEWGVTRHNWEANGGGVQPTQLYRGTKAGYGTTGLVRQQNNASLPAILVRMIIADADIFVTDIIASENKYGTIAEAGPNEYYKFAHFAQIIGIDMHEQIVYLANSITNFNQIAGDPENYWNVSFSDYQDWTNDPENRSSSTMNHEVVDSWLLTIDIVH